MSDIKVDLIPIPTRILTEKDDIIEFLNEWGKVKSNIINQKSIKLNYGALCAKE